MSETLRNRSRELPLPLRLILVAAGVVLLVLLGVAVSLRPSPRGYGTHQQLGLPPCSFIVMFDIRCPSCGMTTAWAHTVRGQLPRALASNVAGTLLGLGALVGAPWALWAAWRGRLPAWHPSARLFVVFASIVIAVAISEWLLRIVWS